MDISIDTYACVCVITLNISKKEREIIKQLKGKSNLEMAKFPF